MKNQVIISFASGEPYLTESKNIKQLAKMSNIDFHLYDTEWLETTDFYKKNTELLNSKKSGFCAWKPYIILDALKCYKKVLYLDSSMLFIPSEIHKHFTSRKLLTSTIVPLKNISHVKHKCFEIMGCNNKHYWNAEQIWAGNILVNQYSKKILNEWLNFCTIKDCISDEVGPDNSREFKYHLYDQSILSLLCIKHKIKALENCTGNCWFYDTREIGHFQYIAKTFGEDVIYNQLVLNKKYKLEYSRNSSCDVY